MLGSDESEVITVTGPVAPASLGVTSMHEHVLANACCYLMDAEERPGYAVAAGVGELTLEKAGFVRRQFSLSEHNLVVDDPVLVGSELEEFRLAGGGTVVEMSTPGLRLEPQALPDISRRSGVHIVAGTGFYVRESRPPEAETLDVDALAARMVDEIERGIDGTAVRAGHIGEIGVTQLDASDERLLRAAVEAAASTGVAISIHPGFEPGNDGVAIADVLERVGAQPERIVLGHADSFLVEHDMRRLIADPAAGLVRLDYHRELLRRGYNLAFDCFGHDWGREQEGWVIESDWQRLAGLIALLSEGHAERLVLGCDVFMRLLHRRGGGLGYAHLLNWVLPALRRYGVDEPTIRQLTVTNPARLLARPARATIAPAE